MTQLNNPFPTLTDEEFQQVTAGVEGELPVLLELFQQEPEKSEKELMQHTSLAKLVRELSGTFPEENAQLEQTALAALKHRLHIVQLATDYVVGALPAYEEQFKREYLLLSELLTWELLCNIFAEMQMTLTQVPPPQQLPEKAKSSYLLLGLLKEVEQQDGTTELVWVEAACRPRSFYAEKTEIVSRALFRAKQPLERKNPLPAVSEDAYQQLCDGRCNELTELFMAFDNEDKEHKDRESYRAVASSKLHQYMLNVSMGMREKHKLMMTTTDEELRNLLYDVGLQQEGILTRFQDWLTSNYMIQLQREYATMLLLDVLQSRAEVYEWLERHFGKPLGLTQLPAGVLRLVEKLGLVSKTQHAESDKISVRWNPDVLLGSDYYFRKQELVADSIQQVEQTVPDWALVD